MFGSMVDIQSATAENRRGKKKERRKIETTAAEYNGLSYWAVITKDGNEWRSTVGFHLQPASAKSLCEKLPVRPSADRQLYSADYENYQITNMHFGLSF